MNGDLSISALKVIRVMSLFSVQLYKRQTLYRSH